MPVDLGKEATLYSQRWLYQLMSSTYRCVDILTRIIFSINSCSSVMELTSQKIYSLDKNNNALYIFDILGLGFKSEVLSL